MCTEKTSGPSPTRAASRSSLTSVRPSSAVTTTALVRSCRQTSHGEPQVALGAPPSGGGGGGTRPMGGKSYAPGPWYTTRCPVGTVLEKCLFWDHFQVPRIFPAGRHVCLAPRCHPIP